MALVAIESGMVVMPFGKSMKRAGDGAGDGGAVSILREGDSDGLKIGAGGDVTLPARDHADVSISIRCGRAVAAVDDAVHEQAARFGHVDRLGDGEGGSIFDHAAGIADGELDIGDHLVVRVFGIEFAGEVASEQLVLAGLSEDLAAIGRRFAVLYGDFGDVRLERGGQRDQSRGYSDLVHISAIICSLAFRRTTWQPE
jgi:hypothetical protein